MAYFLRSLGRNWTAPVISFAFVTAIYSAIRWTDNHREVYGSRVTADVFAPNGKWYVTGDNWGKVTVKEAQSGKVLRTIIVGGLEVQSLDISDDSRMLASTTYDGKLRIWNLTDGKLIHELATTANDECSVIFGRDDLLLVTDEGDQDLASVWKTSTGKKVSDLVGSDEMGTLSLTPDRQAVAMIQNDRTVTWDMRTGKQLTSLDHRAGAR